ncbi:MAG: hypothetical protein CMJ78_04845 [Planctomycetaceae bacterium]|nr:hypothetical protein [Planctomycetaceae bacterium]
MTANQQHEPLDDLLNQWSLGNQISDVESAQLAKQIVDAAVATPSEEAIELARSVTNRRSRSLTSVLTIAVAVMISICFLWSPQETARPLAVINTLPSTSVGWSKEQLQEKAVLLDEMNSLFDGKLKWISEMNGDVQVSLASASSGEGSKPLAVRVVVERRLPGCGDWSAAWTVDLLTHSEQLVSVDGDENAPGFSVWAYVLPDGMITLETDLDFRDRAIAASLDGSADNSAPVLKSATSELHSNGEIREVLQQQVDGIEFRVLQLVSVLEGQVS